jgi:mRNA-degrading endonuclease toxin of MazEF toxin-antitoxin module
LLIPIRCNKSPAVAVADQIRAVAKERLRSRIGTANAAEMEAVEAGLRQVLELP